MAYDADFQRATAKTFEKLGVPPDRPTPRFPRGDISSRRQGAVFVKAISVLQPDHYPDIEKTEYKISGYEQGQISLFSYRIKSAQTTLPEAAVLYMHGGGMIFGDPEMFETWTKSDVAATGVAHFSIDYRLAPEFKHPTPVEDCYAALLWLHANVQQLGIDPARIGVVGLSAGGGLAAAVALAARDRELNPPIAKQILFSPMLDDRNTVTNASLLPLMTWSWDDNWTGWNALLGDELGGSSVSHYAAPARAEQLNNLPATYIDVGSLDIFAEENSLYAKRLKAAGVEVEWHLYEAVPHGFEVRGAGSKIVEQAESNRRAAIRSL